MKVRLSIAAKLGVGFGILTVALIINGVFTGITLNESEKVNERIKNLYTPSEEYIHELASLVEESRMLIRSWVFIDKISETPDKINLINIHKEKFPRVDSSLSILSERWENEEVNEEYFNIAKTIRDTLFPKHQYIMEMLSSLESYDDPLIMFEVMPMVQEGGEVMVLTDTIIKELNVIVEHHEQNIVAARDEMESSLQSFGKFINIALVVLVVFSLGSAYITTRSLTRPINRVKNILLQMAKGILTNDKIQEGKDEIGQMSYALNQLVTSLKDVSSFADEIGRGNFNTDFKPLSEEDTLGNSLIRMRDELSAAAEEEKKRKEEDDQRNWATQGEAKFAEILRENNDNMEELSYNVISNLVKYLDTNQGGLFLINNNDSNHVFIEMSSCYAFDRRKYQQKKIELGEGLIGRCIQEKEPIYMTDIPDEYINITSGLGGENPRSLLLVPLILNDEIFGVIEIASFNEIANYQIEFVGKIGESIASTISMVKTNIKTSELLEQSQQQAEEMSAQEEEMRQNMEELRATQEQSARKEQDLVRRFDEARAKLKEFGIEM